MPADHEFEYLNTPSKEEHILPRHLENESKKLRRLEIRVNELEAKIILLSASEDEIVG